jgi:tripartite-type tricarboxylate transporter receptor subunit TctC
MGFPIAAPPKLPDERAAVLRKAFEATMVDPLFLAEAEKRGLPVRPSSGAEVQKVIEDIVSTPKDAVNLLKQILAEPAASTTTK